MNLHSRISSGGRTYTIYAKRLEKLGITTFEDFLLHIPTRFDDYSLISPIDQLQEGEIATIKGHVLDSKNSYLKGRKMRTMQKVLVTDETGTAQLTWFNQPYLIKAKCLLMK